MISEGAIQISGKASTEIEAATARFLAAGGKIYEAQPLQITPKPLSAGTLKGPLVRGWYRVSKQ